MRHLLKCLATFSCISLVTGCAIKQTSNVSIEDYTNIENTPVYILNNPPLQPEDLNADILSCTDTTEHRLKVENGILKTTGGLTRQGSSHWFQSQLLAAYWLPYSSQSMPL